MEVNIVQTRPSNGFKVYGTVKGLSSYTDGDKKRASLIVEQLSGQNAGREVIVVMKDAPDYKGVRFDGDGLASLGIKKGTNIALTQCDYINKDGDVSVIETRRAVKVGKDFRPKQTLAITSYAASVDKLHGFILTNERGEVDFIDGDRKANLKVLIDQVKLDDDQGVMIVLHGSTSVTKTVDGKDIVENQPLTLQAFISRYHKEGRDGESRLLSKDEFKVKVDKFLDNGKFSSFDGRIDIEAAKAFESRNRVSAAVLPAVSIFLTGSKFLPDSQCVITGLGSVGIGIDPGSSERPYPIIQNGAREAAGGSGFRGLGPNDEPNGGDRVRKNDHQVIWNRLINQVHLLKNLNPEEKIALTEANKIAVTAKPAIEKKPKSEQVVMDDPKDIEDIFADFFDDEENSSRIGY